MNAVEKRNDVIRRLTGIPRPGDMVASEKGTKYQVIKPCACSDRTCVARQTSSDHIRILDANGFWHWEDWSAAAAMGWTRIGRANDFVRDNGDESNGWEGRWLPSIASGE